MGFVRNMFSGGKIAIPKNTASLDDETVRTRAKEQRDLAAKAKGRQSTIETGLLGIGTSADLAKSTLLGG